MQEKPKRGYVESHIGKILRRGSVWRGTSKATAGRRFALPTESIMTIIRLWIGSVPSANATLRFTDTTDFSPWEVWTIRGAVFPAGIRSRFSVNKNMPFVPFGEYLIPQPGSHSDVRLKRGI